MNTSAYYDYNMRLNVENLRSQNKVFQNGVCVISESPCVETEYKNLRWNVFHNIEMSSFNGVSASMPLDWKSN